MEPSRKRTFPEEGNYYDVTPQNKRSTFRRDCPQVFASQHLKLDDLRRKDVENRYLFKENIPEYPRPEFHVSHLKHDTHSVGLRGIRSDSGFRTSPLGFLLWWSLAVEPDDVTSAETRLLEKTFPDRTQEQVQRQQSFLGRFATSPAFMETSMIGSYRFTFPLEEMLEAYREQFCSGDQPVMRVFQTSLFPQQVMYVVLVHSPKAKQKQFSQYPLLTDDPNAVCAYKDGHFIWRPEAMCETHSYELIKGHDEKQMDFMELGYKYQFYVWDHVAVALHLDAGQVLKFDADQLRKKLKFCDQGQSKYNRRTFDVFSDAEKLVKNLWPDYPDALEKEKSLQDLLSASRVTEPESSD